MGRPFKEASEARTSPAARNVVFSKFLGASCHCKLFKEYNIDDRSSLTSADTRRELKGGTLCFLLPAVAIHRKRYSVTFERQQCFSIVLRRD